jgi:hypothetical protein
MTPFDTPDPVVGSLDYGSYPARILLTPGVFNPTQEVVNAVGVISSVGGAGGSNTLVTTNGTAINAGTSQAQPGITVTGVTTASVASWSLPNVPDATWQSGITAFTVCTANTVTLYLSNPTGGTITPVTQKVNLAVQF